MHTINYTRLGLLSLRLIIETHHWDSSVGLSSGTQHCCDYRICRFVQNWFHLIHCLFFMFEHRQGTQLVARSHQIERERSFVRESFTTDAAVFVRQNLLTSKNLLNFRVYLVDWFQIGDLFEIWMKLDGVNNVLHRSFIRRKRSKTSDVTKNSTTWKFKSKPGK